MSILSSYLPQRVRNTFACFKATALLKGYTSGCDCIDHIGRFVAKRLSRKYLQFMIYVCVMILVRFKLIDIIGLMWFLDKNWTQKFQLSLGWRKLSDWVFSVWCQHGGLQRRVTSDFRGRFWLTKMMDEILERDGVKDRVLELKTAKTSNAGNRKSIVRPQYS